LSGLSVLILFLFYRITIPFFFFARSFSMVTIPFYGVTIGKKVFTLAFLVVAIM